MCRRSMFDNDMRGLQYYQTNILFNVFIIAIPCYIILHNYLKFKMIDTIFKLLISI